MGAMDEMKSQRTEEAQKAPLDAHLGIPLTQADRELIVRAADQERLAAASWARMILVRAAEKATAPIEKPTG